ncbi:MAG TPA: lipoyl domain-containing protein [Kouleothrix sp.]|nr:lipoyl domain-containing protein [Kouleothrix sp.]
MMSTEYCLPALPLGGADIAILRWLKAPGQPVLAGEPLLIALNDRVEAVLPAPSDGRVERGACRCARGAR